MFTLFIPYVIATALGISPQDTDVPLAEGPAVAEALAAVTGEAAVEAALADDTTLAPGKAPAPAARAPEPQVPTGQFTTAVEVKPILSMTRPQWVALREYEGQDLLYFSGLAAWRCGLWEVRYGLNGAPPETLVELEPCHDGTAQPNAITDPVGYAIYLPFPLGSVESIDVEITYDDGTTDAAVYARAAVLMP